MTADERKARPVYSGVLRYFPKALMEIARVSLAGSAQHHPGEPLHWDRAKSTDEADALVRHLLEAGTLDTDGFRHTAKVAWRALALLEKELEAAESSAFMNSERSRDREQSEIYVHSSDVITSVPESGTIVPTPRTRPSYDERLELAQPCTTPGCATLVSQSSGRTVCQQCEGRRRSP